MKGLIGPCPVCKMFTLYPFRDQVICRGWLSHTRCAFQGKLADFPDRYKYVPGEAAKKVKFIKEWSHPDPAFAKTLKPLPTSEAGPGEGNAETEESSAADDEDPERYLLPDLGQECQNMVVYFSGKPDPLYKVRFLSFLIFHLSFFFASLIFSSSSRKSSHTTAAKSPLQSLITQPMWSPPTLKPLLTKRWPQP